MPVIFLTSTLIIINIVFWIVFLAKFKKIFSTEDILLAVRNELDKMIADVNRNTARDLNLIDAKLKDLKLAVFLFQPLQQQDVCLSQKQQA